MNTKTMNAQATVFVVDDDQSVRKGISNLLRSAGYRTATFASGREFLAHISDDAGCIILDMYMPDGHGLELQEALTAGDNHIPIIFLTGYGDVPTSVQALKNGAVDYLEKPVDASTLLAAVGSALKKHQENRDKLEQIARTKAQLASLTPREYEVLRHLIAGKLNKQVASALGICEKTVKVHRAQIMRKMGVHSIAELVRLTEQSGVRPIDSSIPKVQ